MGDHVLAEHSSSMVLTSHWTSGELLKIKVTNLIPVGLLILFLRLSTH